MAEQPRDASGRFVERDRERRIAREHGQLIAGLLGTTSGVTDAETPSPSPVGAEGGYRGRSLGDVQRERREAREAFSRLFEPPPSDHDEITYALPELRR